MSGMHDFTGKDVSGSVFLWIAGISGRFHLKDIIAVIYLVGWFAGFFFFGFFTSLPC